MVPAEELALPPNQFALTDATESLSVMPTLPRPTPAEEIVGTQSAFAAYSDGNRDIIATLHGEYVMTFDRSGECVDSFGLELKTKIIAAYITTYVERLRNAKRETAPPPGPQ